MAKHNTIIELNGVRYDAKTGKLLPKTPVHSSAPTPAATPPAAAKHHAMDGFAKKPKTHSPARPVAANAKHHNTEHSKTLMRSVVHKPAHHKVSAPSTHIDKKPAIHSVAKTPIRAEQASSVSPRRIMQATHIKQSKLISKFGHHTAKPVETVLAPLPVRDAPLSVALPASTGTAAPTLLSHNPFANALENATSHVVPKLGKKKLSHRIAKKLRTSPRKLNIASGAMALVIVGGFIVYQNAPKVVMQMAAARSGVRGSLPTYQPSGFALSSKINYEPGQITATYQSNSDDRNFQLTQKKSAWNSETLLDNFVSVDRKQFQVRENNGKTIYIYDGDNATWVDGGVWYKIEGKSALSSEQLLRIIDSM